MKYRVIHDLMLHEAAYAGDAFKLVINLNLLKRGSFDINFKDEDFGNRTALHCAAGEGNSHLLLNLFVFVTYQNNK